MNNLFLAMYVKLQNLANREDGQDLIEYALIASLIALAIITASKGVATAISTTFNDISASLA
jgi:Flp pilus assembly pilin Flp